MRYVVLTFDDGTIYDKRFIEILNKYNIPCSFNLNSGLDDFIWYFNEEKEIRRLNLEENKNIYENHEVCSHSYTHPYFIDLNENQIIEQVNKDIQRLEKIFNREITTFAFPFTEWNDEIINIIKEKTKIKNIRISKISNDYLPQDRFHIHLNAFYDDYDIYKKLEEYSKNNLENALFTIVGHSYEFEVKNDWNKIENLLKYLSSNKDILVTTLEEAINNIY
ncbi:MAG: hypothetical protein E7180_00365 [Erysipelotrichaceae bacterium]|nr:hypothetical protein [Erysipelotrichaceae bacterium]